MTIHVESETDEQRIERCDRKARRGRGVPQWMRLVACTVLARDAIHRA